MGTTDIDHVYCSDCEENKVKRSIAEESDQWTHTDEGWLCPTCNPESDAQW